MKVFLIGFMGSGKTTAARRLAARMNCGWEDLDHIIEQETGMSIAQIFRDKGEQAFRDLESRYLKEGVSRPLAVLATGGGTPCYHENMQWMNRTGITVYLKMTAEQLFSRLKETRSNRPLLKGLNDEDLLHYIVQKLRDREPFYNMAHIHIPGFNLDVRSLEDKIYARLKQ